MGTKWRFDKLPRPLVPPGDIYVAAVGGPPDGEKYQAGIAALEAAGHPVHRRDDVLTRSERYLAGSAAVRAAELAAAYAGGPVWCARGGYGAMHLLAAFVAAAAELTPRLVIGFSDVTALGCGLLTLGIPWLHAPLLTTLAGEPSASREHLAAVLAGRGRGLSVRGDRTVVGGRANGPLLGGSLSLISALCGTPYLPVFDGAVLVLEDVTESPYRLDRMLMQLELAGVLSRVAGVALGYFTRCDAPDKSHTGRQVVEEMCARYGVPVLSGLPVGHEAPNFALPMGAEVTLDADARTLTIESEIVA